MKLAHGIVVSAHRLASEAGATVLRKGGNAFDAAVATSLMLGVAEPAFSGIGGGGFALLHSHSGENLALDYREVAPLGSSASMFVGGSESNSVGPLAVATPGLLAGQARILEEFGTMKFRDLADPAIKAARSGVGRESLSRRMLVDNTAGVVDKIRRFKTSADVFLGRSKLPLLAGTLAGLAQRGPGHFYQGEILAKTSRHLKSLGGLLCEDDFAKYKVKDRRPVQCVYRDYELLSMPPPSAGGTLLAYGLKIMEELEGRAKTHGDTVALNIRAAVLEAMLREKPNFGDPEFVDVPVKALLSGASARKKADEIRSRAEPPTHSLATGPGSTSHFCVVDGLGNAVAATETIECFYGSGVTVPGLGIILNDEMHDFDTDAGKPNSVEPLKRPASSMTPTMMLKDGIPFLVLGGAGSERIISSVFQVIDNVIERKMSLPRALAAPRVHPTGEGLMVEGGFSRTTVAGLKKLRPQLKVRKRRDLYFGGVQAAILDVRSGKLSGAADPRRLGAAVLA